MNEIKCPNCGTSFSLKKDFYDSIIKQIHDQEFKKEIQKITAQKEEEKNSFLEISKLNFEQQLNTLLNKKDLEIEKLKDSLEKNYINTLNELELNNKDLENKLKVFESKSALNLHEALAKKDQEISELKNKIELNKNDFLMKNKNMEESYEEKIKAKDELISYYKDFKARQSTKMLGESLEQHCYNAFNIIRPLFKNVYFEKDNDSKNGSKGDFIFRDYDDLGLEVVSIMFEMKNEADETSTKHKNEDFLKELNKDRNEKKCEYAVLVSLLEIDNDLYNNGIVDMSHKYPKMYVIRPQFFISFITLIRNMALNSLEYKKELQIVKNENLDIKEFEKNLNSFKSGFGRNYRLASEKFKKAIEEIDKTIMHLQKTKESLISSENNLRLANNKAEDLTIKKLTVNSKVMAKMFEKEKKESVEC